MTNAMVPASTTRVCEKYSKSSYARTPDWRYRLSDDGEYVRRNETVGLLLANETECIEECDTNDMCIAISFRRDGKCIMLAQCAMTSRVGGYNYYVKRTFNGNKTYDIDFGLECKNPSVPHHTGMVPSTVPECWNECVKLEGCTVAEIDDNMECVLHSECESFYYEADTRQRRGMIITGGPMNDKVGPTNAPTTAVPTNRPSANGTYSPTTQSPTSMPTADAPTAIPTAGPDTDAPTDPPTFPPHEHVEHDDGSLSLGAKIGIGLGVTFIILLIIMAIVVVYKRST